MRSYQNRKKSALKQLTSLTLNAIISIVKFVDHIDSNDE